LLLFSGVAALLTLKVPDGGIGSRYGPSFFPWLMVIGIAVFSCLLLIRSLWAQPAPAAGTRRPAAPVLAKMGVVLVLLIAYAAGFIKAPYVITSSIFYILAMLVLGERRPLHAVVVPVAIVVGVFLVFTRIMQVYLP
ncbi:MAG: tripartite tricarboxylate transporter TctB family protein, partial [Planctomycetes bacterium]|nr:tripartite tricarboxylate transporter TctB family protein [Planctomycetota bacterium]